MYSERRERIPRPTPPEPRPGRVRRSPEDVGGSASRASLAALAQETRLDGFRRLVCAGGAGLAAEAIADELGIPSATLSFHLEELENAGVVRCRRDGRSLIYAPDFAAMNALLAPLTEKCCRAGRRSRLAS